MMGVLLGTDSKTSESVFEAYPPPVCNWSCSGYYQAYFQSSEKK